MASKVPTKPSIVTDLPIGEDYLGYSSFSNALSSIFYQSTIRLPITIGIFAEWGKGKSFLLNKIKQNIHTQINHEDKKDVIVSFNVWEYAGSDVLWAGLVQQIFTKVESKFTRTEIRIYQYLTYVFLKKNTLQKCLFIFGWIIRVLLVVISSALLYLLVDSSIQETLSSDIVIGGFFGVSILSIVPSIIIGIINLCKDVGKEISVKSGKIKEQLGFMADVKSELEMLFAFLRSKKSKLIVFIDDLDRCPPERIIKMIDAMMLLLSNPNFPCLSYITIDPKILIGAIESHYDSMGNYDIKGFEYIDKLIQIPFYIPYLPPYKNNLISKFQTNIAKSAYILNQTCVNTFKFIKEYPGIYSILKNDKITFYLNKIDGCINLADIFIKSNFLHLLYLSIYNYVKTKQKRMLHILLTDSEYIGIFLNSFYGFVRDNYTKVCCSRISTKQRLYQLILDFFYEFNKQMNSYFDVIVEDGDPNNNIELLQIKNTKELNKYILDLENPDLTDHDYCEIGDFFKKNKDTIDITHIIKYKDRLNSFMDNKFTRFSPHSKELYELLINFNDIIDKRSIIKNVTYSLTNQDQHIFNDFSLYFDTNCRRNKRLINLYSMVRYMMDTKIHGWFSDKPVTLHLKKIVVKLLILFEQWPYHMCFLFHQIETHRIRLLKIGTRETCIDCDVWHGYHRLNTLQDFFDTIDTNLFLHECMRSFLVLDYDSNLFTKFLSNYSECIINIENFYLCLPYIININSFIRNKIRQFYDFENPL